MFEQFQGTLFVPEITKEVFPEVRVEVVYCKETAWTVHWGMWELEKNMRKLRQEGAKGRDVNVRMSERGNHFVSIDFGEFMSVRLMMELS